MEEKFKATDRIFATLIVLLVPIFFLPMFPDPFETGKIALFFALVVIFAILKLIGSIKAGKMEISLGKYDIAIFVLLVSYLVSSFVATPNKMDAFLLPGRATLITLLAVFYFLVSQLRKSDKEKLILPVLISGALVSLSLLISLAEGYKLIPQLPSFMKAHDFNPLGNPYASFAFLASLLPLGIGITIGEKKPTKKIVSFVALAFIIFGAAISVINLLPYKNATALYPTFKSSWEVAIDSLKEKPILGYGPGNYSSAFEKFKTVSFNQTEFWNQAYTNGRNFYFTHIAETGFLGAFAIIILLLSISKVVKENIVDHPIKVEWLPYQARAISLLFLIILLGIFPAAVCTLILLFTLLAITSDSNQKTVIKLRAENSYFPSLVVALPVVLVVLYSSYIMGKAYLGEIQYKKAIAALNSRNAQLTLDHMSKAVKLGPKVDRYHVSAAQIYLLLIQSNLQNQNLSDDQKRTQLQKLVQLAVQEAKLGAQTNQGRASNWAVLGSVYQQISPLVQGSSDFALQAYSQAILLSPVNPEYRIALGGIYYSQGDYEKAIDVFKLAIVAKQDHPNAHYNLAYAYRSNGDIKKAITEMTTVLSLVEKDSTDYQLVQAELKNLEAQDAAAKQQGTETLTPPETVDEGSQVTPPIDINEVDQNLSSESASPTPLP